MKRIVFFTGVVLVLCLSAYAQQGVPSSADATAVNTNATSVNTYAGTGFNTVNNTPVNTNTNVAAAGGGEGGAGGSSTTSGDYDNQITLGINNELNFPEAEKQRTPIPGLPMVYPAFPRNDAQGPQIYGPMPNGGVEVFKWGEGDAGAVFIKRARKILGCDNPLHGGLGGVVGNIGNLVLSGKAGYQAKGFLVSNFPRGTGPRTTEGGGLLPLIIINHSKFALTDELLCRAGYICVGNLSILPPAHFKGAVIDDSVMKGVYLDLLKPTNVAIAQLIYQTGGQPVTETKTTYVGLGGSTNGRQFGLTVGGGQTTAESFTSTRWPSLMKCWVYDPKTAAKHLAAPKIVEKIMEAQPGRPVSPSELLKAVDSGTIQYLEQMKSVPTSNSPAPQQPSPPAKADARDAKSPVTPVSQRVRPFSIEEVVAGSPSLH